MFLEISKYPHNEIIKQSKINENELSDDLRIMIADFIKRYNGYKLKGNNEANAKILMTTSNLISQNIYDYYVEKEEQEVVIDKNETPTKSDIKEVVADIKEAIADPKPEEIEKPDLKPGESLISDPKPEEKPDPIPEESPKLDPKPEEVPTDIEPVNKNEKALYTLFKEGKTSNISRSLLYEKGFNTSIFGPLGSRGCRVGSYELKKEFSETEYSLVKHA